MFKMKKMQFFVFSSALMIVVFIFVLMVNSVFFATSFFASWITITLKTTHLGLVLFKECDDQSELFH